VGTSRRLQFRVRCGAYASLLVGAFLCLSAAGCSGSSSSVSPEGAPESSQEKAKPEPSATSDQARSPDATPEGLTVVFASNIDGEIEPCG
jgi:hypothetical protein